jgi:hypothetical protein
MEPIPEEIVEKTWQEVAGFSPDRVKKEMMKIGNRHPELLPFVMESSQEMGREVRGLRSICSLLSAECFKRPMGRSKRFPLRRLLTAINTMKA